LPLSVCSWFADILGTAGGGAGVSGSSDAAAYRVDSRLVTPSLKTLDVLLSQGLLACLDRHQPHGHASDAAGGAPPPPLPRLSFGEEVAAVTRRRLETGGDDVPRTLAGAQGAWRWWRRVPLRRRRPGLSQSIARSLACPLPASLASSAPVTATPAAVLMGLLPFTAGLARARAALALLDLLGHPFPRVRRAVAEALYARLLALDAGAWAETTTAAVTVATASSGGGSSASASATELLRLALHRPDLDAAVAVLADVVWDGDAASVALPARDRLYRSLLGLPAPPPGRAMADTAGAAAAGAGAAGRGGGAGAAAGGGSGYASLVRDAGY
jgi:hypothetical protein